jgi:hypothetical protein
MDITFSAVTSNDVTPYVCTMSQAWYVIRGLQAGIRNLQPTATSSQEVKQPRQSLHNITTAAPLLDWHLCATEHSRLETLDVAVNNT